MHAEQSFEPRPVNSLDALRAVALLRVFLWHATGWAALTWVAALPVMVLLTGMLTGRTLLRTPTATVVLRRVKRLLIPFWVFSLAALGSMWFIGGDIPTQVWWWVLPLWDPRGVAWEEGWMSTPLWYLRMLLWLFALLPVLWFAARRALKTSITVLVAGVVALELTAGTSLWAVQDIVLFSVFAVAGLGTAAWTVPQFSKRWWPLIPSGALAACAWVLWKGTSGVVNDSHVLHLLVGAVTVGAAGVTQPLFGRLAQLAPRVVGWFARSSLSVYLWHTTAVFTVLKVSEPWRASAGDTLWVQVAVAAAGLALTVLWVPFVVWFEDQGTRRPAGLSRRVELRGPLLWRAATLSLVLVLALTGPDTRTTPVWQPPVPSQAPEANELAARTPVDFEFLSVSDGENMTGADVLRGTRNPDDRNDPSLAGPVSPTARTVEDVATWVPSGSPKDLELRGMLDRYAAQHDEAGLGVLLVRVGGMAWYHGAGASPVRPEETHPLMSITKLYTGALVMQAAEEGRIDLNTPVGSLTSAPWFISSQATTWLEYLTHMSGLVNYRDTKAYRADPASIDDWEPALRAVHAEGLLFSPGERIEYSSTNYLVLGVALEQLYGKPVEELLRGDLLEPLGLNETKVLEPVPGEPYTGTAGMFATPQDLAHWVLASWVDRQILSDDSVALQQRVHPFLRIGPGSIGFCPCSQSGMTGFGHNGGTLTLRWYPKEQTIVVYTSRVSIWEKGMQKRIDSLIAGMLTALQS